MSKKIIKVTVSSDASLEKANITLEGRPVKLKPSFDWKKFTSIPREITIEGKLNIFFKCKGWQYTEVKLTIENITDNKKVIEDKKVIIGDEQDEQIRIGRYVDDIAL